jgi:hypothetical protein
VTAEPPRPPAAASAPPAVFTPQPPEVFRREVGQAVRYERGLVVKAVAMLVVVAVIVIVRTLYFALRKNGDYRWGCGKAGSGGGWSSPRWYCWR